MMRLVLLAAAWLALCVPASPQGGQSVVVQPKNVNVANASGAIAATGVFQQIWAASPQSLQPGRSGCTVQNNGTHNMNVYAGPIAGATTSNSAVLQPGQAYYCGAPGELVVRDQISITGTVAEAFYATQY